MSKKIEIPAALRGHHHNGEVHWQAVFSEGGTHIGWHCHPCGQAVGLDLKAQAGRCAFCYFLHTHADGCKYIEQLAADMRKRADACHVRAEKDRALSERLNGQADRADKAADKLTAKGRTEEARKKTFRGAAIRSRAVKAIVRADKSIERAAKLRQRATALLEKAA